jgi:hypothetical protein
MYRLAIGTLNRKGNWTFSHYASEEEMKGMRVNEYTVEEMRLYVTALDVQSIGRRYSFYFKASGKSYGVDVEWVNVSEYVRVESGEQYTWPGGVCVEYYENDVVQMPHIGDGILGTLFCDLEDGRLYVSRSDEPESDQMEMLGEVLAQGSHMLPVVWTRKDMRCKSAMPTGDSIIEIENRLSKVALEWWDDET